jgi:hypothetical protein
VTPSATAPTGKRALEWRASCSALFQGLLLDGLTPWSRSDCTCLRSSRMQHSAARPARSPQTPAIPDLSADGARSRRRASTATAPSRSSFSTVGRFAVNSNACCFTGWERPEAHARGPPPRRPRGLPRDQESLVRSELIAARLSCHIVALHSPSWSASGHAPLAPQASRRRQADRRPVQCRECQASCHVSAVFDASAGGSP